MATDDDGSCQIREEDLAQSVLTLNEVMLTFDVESTMFNIKLHGQEGEYRTVVLTKNEVEIEGKKKMIVIIRDVTDKVRLEQGELKKKKEKVRAGVIQKELTVVFSQQCVELQ